MERAARLLADLAETVSSGVEDISAIGFGLPMPVDAISGEAGSDAVLPGWRGVNVTEAMSGYLRAPVALDNTANLAALGELHAGALRGVRNGCYLKFSYGVGAGIVINGDVFRGSAGTAGEIGHVTIDENGPICRCGNREALDRCAIPSAAATVDLRPAELGDEADIVGAIHRASMLSHTDISIS